MYGLQGKEIGFVQLHRHQILKDRDHVVAIKSSQAQSVTAVCQLMYMMSQAKERRLRKK